MLPLKRQDQLLGCLLGGALGDAFGGAYENQSPPIAFAAARDWRLSDDTQLTLATCEAILEAISKRYAAL